VLAVSVWIKSAALWACEATETSNGEPDELCCRTRISSRLAFALSLLLRIPSVFGKNQIQGVTINWKLLHLNPELFLDHQVIDCFSIDQDYGHSSSSKRSGLSTLCERRGCEENSLLEFALDGPAELVDFGSSDRVAVKPFALESNI